jgi:hypothetical protein
MASPTAETYTSQYHLPVVGIEIVPVTGLTEVPVVYFKLPSLRVTVKPEMLFKVGKLFSGLSIQLLSYPVKPLFDQ